jgi:hypothetical protein
LQTANSGDKVAAATPIGVAMFDPSCVMPQRRTLHLLLALLLLLTQQLAAAHGYSHPDPGSIADHACEMCAAYAQLGSGLVSSAPPLAPALGASEPFWLRPSARVARLQLAFHSRAPPALLL